MEAEALLGGKTRFAVLEALADARRPMTAYQIAVIKGLDPAAAYRCIAEFAEFGIVDSKAGQRNQTSYRLSKAAGKAAAELLRSLKQKASGSADLEGWLAPDMQAERMAKIVRLDAVRSGKAAERKRISELLSRRAPRELAALIESSQIAFNDLFERKNGVFILKARRQA